MEKENFISISEFEDFYFDTCEDWQLWDEEEKGEYPAERILEAMKKFLNYHKSK